jgi:hypothetical protein
MQGTDQSTTHANPIPASIIVAEDTPVAPDLEGQIVEDVMHSSEVLAKDDSVVKDNVSDPTVCVPKPVFSEFQDQHTS